MAYAEFKQPPADPTKPQESVSDIVAEIIGSKCHTRKPISLEEKAAKVFNTCQT
jgi:hypothetical protein